MVHSADTLIGKLKIKTILYHINVTHLDERHTTPRTVPYLKLSYKRSQHALN